MSNGLARLIVDFCVKKLLKNSTLTLDIYCSKNDSDKNI